MTNASKGCQQLSVESWPELLVWLKLGTPEAQGFPASVTSLLEHSSHGQFASVGGESQVCTWDGMVEEGRRCQS